jgi:hypothetical protein
MFLKNLSKDYNIKSVSRSSIKRDEIKQIKDISLLRNESSLSITQQIKDKDLWKTNTALFDSIKDKIIFSDKDFKRIIICDDVNHIFDVNSFYIEKFQWDNKTFILKTPVICYVEYDEGLWIYKVPDYDLIAFSEDKEEALTDLNEEFVFLCEDLLNELDENLTCGAIKLKNLIKSNLDKIV